MGSSESDTSSNSDHQQPDSQMIPVDPENISQDARRRHPRLVIVRRWKVPVAVPATVRLWKIPLPLRKGHVMGDLFTTIACLLAIM